jgi:hypothetical protein
VQSAIARLAGCPVHVPLTASRHLSRSQMQVTRSPTTVVWKTASATVHTVPSRAMSRLTSRFSATSFRAGAGGRATVPASPDWVGVPGCDGRRGCNGSRAHAPSSSTAVTAPVRFMYGMSVSTISFPAGSRATAAPQPVVARCRHAQWWALAAGNAGQPLAGRPLKTIPRRTVVAEAESSTVAPVRLRRFGRWPRPLSEKDTLNLDPDQVRQAETQKQAAVSTVDNAAQTAAQAIFDARGNSPRMYRRAGTTRPWH